MTRSSQIGFIGIGSMGWPMASRLIHRGHKIAVYDASGERVRDFVAQIGGEAMGTPAELAARSDVLITMLPTSAVVERVLTGESGVLGTLQKGSLILDMSSGAPSRTLAFAHLVADAGSTLIDAPVSGGVERATSGTLAIMVGGSDDDFVRAEPILSTMGSSMLRTGGIGSAHAMKALNNLASAAGLLISIETLLIGKKFGLDPARMVDVLNASTGMNNSTQKKLKQFVLSRRFDAGFGLDLMVKDLSIAIDLGKETSTPVPFAALCREIWASAAACLGAGRDHTEIALWSERLARAEL